MLRVGGFTPLSTTDWPGMLTAVVFCQGCPWRCRYCHNPELIPSRGESELGWDEILRFLERRQGLLDGVVFSGGEPTVQRDLGNAMRDVRALGYRVGLHTSGAYPRRLADVLPLVDWVGIDAKAPYDDYAKITGRPGSGALASASLDLVLASPADHEVRTTVHPRLLDNDALARLDRELTSRGVRQHRLQRFRADGCRDKQLVDSSRPADVGHETPRIESHRPE